MSGLINQTNLTEKNAGAYVARRWNEGKVVDKR